MREVNEKIPDGPASHPSEKLSGVGNQDFQGKFHHGAVQYSQGIPASSMVSTYPTRYPHSQLYQKLHIPLTNRWLQPHLHIMDNECPHILQKFMREVNEKFQLVPPHIHRRNSAEWAIRTFKEHFIAGLSSTHKDFPLHLWCQLIPHAILTFNLLRQFCMNPKLSGYAQLHGVPMCLSPSAFHG